MYRPTNPQSSLFEVDAVLPDALPKDDWSFLYREKVLPLIDEEAFRPLYAESGGRPNAPIKAMVSLLIFMGLEKLAWRAAEYLFPRRLDWMIATHTAPKPVFVICVKTTLMFGAPGNGVVPGYQRPTHWPPTPPESRLVTAQLMDTLIHVETDSKSKVM